MRSAQELRADEGFRAALSQNGVCWTRKVSFASDEIRRADGALGEIAHHYRLETEALAAQIRETYDPVSGELRRDLHRVRMARSRADGCWPSTAGNDVRRVMPSRLRWWRREVSFA
jgi:hypothetical protein